MKRITLLFTICLAACFLSPAAFAFSLPASSQQLVVGQAASWNSSYVELTFYERSGSGSWKKVGKSWKGRLGRNGLAWGRGIHPVPGGATMKREGDGRAPAGVFHLGGAWGYDASIQRNPALNYIQVTPRCLWYEDSSSPFYNQYRRIPHNPKTSEEKKAQMKQGDHAHSLKLFIAHNAYPNTQPYAGSSIFFHIWRGGGSKSTAGCTTMSESSLRNLIARVDPGKKPLYVLLPKAEYKSLRSSWRLP